MKISATCAGGFSGLTEHYEVDTERAPDGARLEALLHQLAASAPAQVSVGTDLARWVITYDEGGARRTLAIVDDGAAAACPHFRGLIAHLRASA